ncbi:MAG: zinc ribbon domain-containing protein [Euryarchaeota archaeon]|nr:zinc ribbon domain-containing protein [Euryarchaeota archaeon]MDE1835328.1 zinc ribbon domain-containing protein [Euryarchaeota archaeon]MDE1880777.1 zinc ribbon domain-containing protein [Euryarchaeota archaeon]MDE2043624.1 zinc ribbon domain-containing protein [Thermoplasmata archaeon]
MFCNACGQQNPDGAAFCARCGRPLAATASGGAPAGYGAPPPPPPPQQAAAPIDLKSLKCKQCGAPLNPSGNDAIITCEYCGTSVTISGAGLKAIQNHSMLVPQVLDQQQAMAAVGKWMNSQGLFHRHDYETSKLLEAKVQMVPFWIIPSSAVTHYVYQDAGVEAAEIGGGLAAAALLGGRGGGAGNLLGGMMLGSAMGGGGANMAKRAAELAGQYQFPIIGVKGLGAYQPKEYQFDLTSRVPYDKRKAPNGIPVLNGDVSEDDAKFQAKNMVVQLQAAKARHQHRMIEQLNTEVNVSDGELLHAPVWYMNFQKKNGQNEMIVIDAARNAVMNAQKQ